MVQRLAPELILAQVKRVELVVEPKLVAVVEIVRRAFLVQLPVMAVREPQLLLAAQATHGEVAVAAGILLQQVAQVALEAAAKAVKALRLPAEKQSYLIPAHLALEVAEVVQVKV